MGVFRMNHEDDHDYNRSAQSGKADHVLTFIRDGTLRKDFLEFPCGDQAAREGERSDDDFEPDLQHLEPGEMRGTYVILRDADERGGKSAKGVARSEERRV